jgi:hypothetical protein
MASSGVPGLPTPNDSNDIQLRLNDLQRQLDELPASIMRSVTGLVALAVSVASDRDDTTNFSLTSGSWVTVATASIAPPDGFDGRGALVASGMVYLVANTSFAVPSMRLVVNGSTSMEVELPEGTGASAIPYYGALSHNVTATGGSDATAELQVYVVSSSAWYTGSANRKASVNLTAIFTK